MNIVKKAFSWLLIYKIFCTLKYGYKYIKDKIRIGEVFYSNSFRLLVKKYMNLDLQEDWIGRLYGVLNPNIDINGNLNINNMIIEINGDATNNIEQVKVWTYRQLYLVGELFKLQGLYDFIDVDFRHVGPINGDNYLIVFDIASRQRFAYFLKRAIWQSILYIAIGVGLWYLYVTYM